ncbi:MAG: Ni/Fe hydrogenase subunit alpha [Anaerolineae bacterium]|nr:Ni/Fe hydrogenase subunit alpha [Anaerolineae bacterium]
MTKQIVIDPITRIEGHSKITIQLDDNGRVEDARFHVTQYRGFERFCEGRPFYEMPSLMGRICGICTISHELASAKACDEIMAVQIPETADMLRRIVNLASVIQSHALSFFYLSSPDFLLGLESDPATRNIFGLAQKHPEIARDGVRLRRFGQEIIEWMAGKRVHPNWIVPGGVGSPLEPEVRDRILETIPEAYAIVQHSLDWFKRSLENYADEIRTFGNFPTLFMGLVSPTGGLELYDGSVRVVDERGSMLVPGFAPDSYQEYIGEAVEPWTFMKFPYYKPVGYPDGIYRVGPLARLNIIDACGTPQADQEWAEFRQLDRGMNFSSFYFHYARLIECLFAIERLEQHLNDPRILDKRVRAYAGPNSGEGIGITEAPRGTLIHHYRADSQGRITWSNLVVATTHNNLAMNRGVKQVAHRYVEGDRLTEGMLNRVEAVIRTFDPCLSCSTHAQDRLALHVELVSPDGEMLDQIWRD